MSTSRSALLASAVAIMFTASSPAHAQDLTELDLQTLMCMDITVTSAAKRAQVTSDAAAAVYVITREEIRRSGATSLPEVLRMAPGIQVARINSRAWAVSARGYNSRFSTKLLVMVDGRSIYTPMFSGVIWEEQPVFLDSIERIEIVRGPGGALWGINAVNGIVNIITRNAAEMRGLQVHVGSGSEENISAGMSYGASSALGDYRVYANHRETDSFDAQGSFIRQSQAGWRLDGALAGGAFSFHGDFSQGDYGAEPPYPAASLAISADTGSVSFGWDRGLQVGDLNVSTHYSWVNRGLPGDWDESNFGLEAQFNARRIGRHVFTAGAGYRFTQDEMQKSFLAMSLNDARVSQHEWSIYAQDEVHFFSDQVRLIVGAKLEDLEFTGLAFQPTVRGLWHVNDEHTVWAAASRAVRTPSRTELHSEMYFGSVTADGLTMLRMSGNEDLDAEDLHAYELGWRWRPYHSLSFDVALFRNHYDRLIVATTRSAELIPGPVPIVVLTSNFANAADTTAEGVELVAEWAALDWLRFQAQSTWQNTNAPSISGLSGSIDPKRMHMLRAQLDLPHGVNLDLRWRWVAQLAGMGIAGYDSLDLRAAWRPRPALELSMTVDNLFDDEHIEYPDDLALAAGAPIGRTVFARVTWQPGW
jgi:iron complex outermembrane receptor protein